MWLDAAARLHGHIFGNTIIKSCSPCLPLQGLFLQVLWVPDLQVFWHGVNALYVMDVPQLLENRAGCLDSSYRQKKSLFMNKTIFFIFFIFYCFLFFFYVFRRAVEYMHSVFDGCEL